MIMAFLHDSLQGLKGIRTFEIMVRAYEYGTILMCGVAYTF